MRDKRLSAYIQQKNWNLTPISLRQIERVAKRLRSVAAFKNRRKIEYGKWNHGSEYAAKIRNRKG